MWIPSTIIVKGEVNIFFGFIPPSPNLHKKVGGDVIIAESKNF